MTRMRPLLPAAAKPLRGALAALGKRAALSAAGKCPGCGVAEGTNPVQVGPVFVKLCDTCSKPLWHALGFIDWFRSR
jgi:hypothetical protein